MLDTRRALAPSSSTLRYMVPAWPQSSSSLCNVAAARTISPVTPHDGSAPKVSGCAAGPLAGLDRLPQRLDVVVRVLAGHRLGVGLGPEIDALVGLEVVLDPELLAAAIDPHERVAGVAVHVHPRLRDAAITHQPRHLVG